MAIPIVSPSPGATLLPRTISGPIFEDVARRSVVQQLARRVNLPPGGTAIPVFTGKPTASWVAEAEQKPVSDATVGTKLMDPKKLAVIVLFSKEYLRRDTPGLVQAIRPQIIEAFADAFDAAAIHGTNSPFTTYIAATTKTVEFGDTAQGDGGVYGDLIAGLKLLTDDRKRLTGWAADPMVEPILMAGTDTTGRPLLVDTNSEGISQRLIGRPVGFGEGVSGVAGDENVRLVGGDWSKVAYGIGSDITFDTSTQATVTLADDSNLNLWQNNLVGLLAEVEYGLVIADVEHFVTYTEAAAS